MSGIVTTADVVGAYRELSTPFFLIGELDQVLRKIIARAFTMHGVTWLCDPEGSRTLRSFDDTARRLVSDLVSFAPVRHRSPAVTRQAYSQVTDVGEPVRTPASSVGKRVGGNPSRVRISHPPRTSDQAIHQAGPCVQPGPAGLL